MPKGKYPRKPRAKTTTKRRNTVPAISDFRDTPSAQRVDGKLSEVERTLFAIIERVSTNDILVQSAGRHAIEIVKSLRKELYAVL